MKGKFPIQVVTLAHPMREDGGHGRVDPPAGEAVLEIRGFAGKDAETGKKRYVTCTVRGERREAEVALGRLLGEIDDGQHVVRAGTVGELCERWYAHASPDLSPAVAAEYRRLLDKRVLPRWADVPLRRLRTADLDQWYSELRRSGAAGGKPLAANTVMRSHVVLRRALAQGVKWGWLTVNPTANASPPRSKKQHLELPDPGEVARLIETAAKVNPSLPTYFRLAAATGARRGELCALRWKHIDLDKRRVTIARSMAEVGGELIEKDTKTHQVRKVRPEVGPARSTTSSDARNRSARRPTSGAGTDAPTAAAICWTTSRRVKVEERSVSPCGPAKWS